MSGEITIVMIRSWPQRFLMAKIKCQAEGTVHHNSKINAKATVVQLYHDGNK